jgi:hypothetical protein
MTNKQTATKRSNNPEVDGYNITYNGYPYHVHPTLTPSVWLEFKKDLAAGKYIVKEYVPEDIKPYTPKELTPQEKLEKAGLSVDELKQLLGLK